MRGKRLPLPLILLAFSTGIVSAFLPRHAPGGQGCGAAASYHQHQPSVIHDDSVYPSMRAHDDVKRVTLKMSYGRDSYNDDAFGLIFLTGGVLTQDVDFAGTFFVLSAIAATITTAGLIEKDDRVPGAVALLTLLFSPVVSSIRQTGSLDALSPPLAIEIGLCTVSAVWAFVKWSRAQNQNEEG